MPENISNPIETHRNSGILLVDKPSGWTSHDVVKFIRGFGFKKVGHCGTLDPLATGLLIILLEKATKLSDKLSSETKSYQCNLCLGIETDTQDADGKIINEADWSTLSKERVQSTISSYIGEQAQTPPMYSAKKIKGKALYKLARKGIDVKREPVNINIFSIVVKTIDFPVVTFDVVCSKGTYVRTLCHDIGQELGCGAHLQQLRRTNSGEFNIDNAVSIDQIKQWNKNDLIGHSLPLDNLRFKNSNP